MWENITTPRVLTHLHQKLTHNLVVSLHSAVEATEHEQTKPHTVWTPSAPPWLCGTPWLKWRRLCSHQTPCYRSSNRPIQWSNKRKYRSTNNVQKNSTACCEMGIILKLYSFHLRNPTVMGYSMITLGIFQTNVTSIRWRKWFKKTGLTVTVPGQIHGCLYYY